jgi:hypothetical protein
MADVLPKVPSAFAAPDTSWERAAECVQSRPGETGTLLCSHPLSVGRDFPFRARDWPQSGRQATCPGRRADRRRLPLGGGPWPRRLPPGAAPSRPTGGDSESGPVTRVPRRSPGVVGCHVPVYVPVYRFTGLHRPGECTDARWRLAGGHRPQGGRGAGSAGPGFRLTAPPAVGNVAAEVVFPLVVLPGSAIGPVATRLHVMTPRGRAPFPVSYRVVPGPPRGTPGISRRPVRPRPVEHCRVTDRACRRASGRVQPAIII